MMQLWIIALVILMPIPLLAQVQNSECKYLGIAATAAWADTKHAGDPDPPYRAIPDTYCPVGSVAYTDWMDPLEKYCALTARRTFINEGGYGTCGKGTNIVTPECFDYDACMAATQGFHGSCVDRKAIADATYYGPAVLDCGNLQGEPVNAPDGGIWYVIQWGGYLYAKQPMRLAIIDGEFRTDYAAQDWAHCGTWPVRGSIDGTGKATLFFTNPNPPQGACGPSFSATMNFDQWYGHGTWLHTLPSGREETGPLGMRRLTLPAGLSKMQVTQSAPVPQGTIPPWTVATPGPTPTVPPKPVLNTPSISGNGFVYVTWPPNANTNDYLLYKAPAPGGPFTLVTPQGIGKSTQPITYKLSGLTNDMPVYIGLIPRNAVGIGPMSNVVSRTPMMPPAAFTVAGVSTLGKPGTPPWPPLQITWGAAWADPTATHHYRVWTRLWRPATQQYDTNYTLLADNLPATTRTFTVPGLTVGHGNVYLVQAYNDHPEEWVNTPEQYLEICGRRICH